MMVSIYMIASILNDYFKIPNMNIMNIIFHYSNDLPLIIHPIDMRTQSITTKPSLPRLPQYPSHLGSLLLFSSVTMISTLLPPLLIMVPPTLVTCTLTVICSSITSIAVLLGSEELSANLSFRLLCAILCTG